MASYSYSSDFNLDKIYRHLGFSSTIDSSFASPSTLPRGVAWDGTNIITVDDDLEKIYLHSGFSAQISASFSSPSTFVGDVAWDGSNLISTDISAAKIYRHSGFNITITASFSSPDIGPSGVAWDGTNVISSDYSTKLIYKHSQFTDTVTASFSSPSTDPYGLAWDHSDLLSVDTSSDKIYKHSGFNDIIRSSFNAPSLSPYGIDMSSSSSSSSCSFSSSSSSSSSSLQKGYTFFTNDFGTDKVYRHSGFGAVIDASFSTPSTLPVGIAWDGSNIISGNNAVLPTVDIVYKHSGFSDTILASFSMHGGSLQDLEWDGTNLLSADHTSDTIYRHCGFSAIISLSVSVPKGASGVARGLTWDGTNLISGDTFTDMIYRHSGFTATVAASFSSPGVNPGGLTWQDPYLYSVDINTDKIYRHSGFGAVILASFSSPSTSPWGVAMRSSSSSSSSSSTSLSRVSDEYIVEEAKDAGAKPKAYIAFMRTEKEFVSADYAAGTHTNTEFTGGVLQLSAGQSSGNWTSAVLDSAHLTPNVIFDRMTWTEVLNGGTVVIQLKSAATSGAVPAATAVTYQEGSSNTRLVLQHTARHRYWQIIITFTSTGTSPTVASFTVRHKALIPTGPNEYHSLGNVNYGVDPDFKSITAGGVSVTLDNSAHQWEKRNSSSYIYGIAFYYEKLEIWAGFELADGTIEYLLQFLGEVESLSVSSGDGGEIRATLTARDFLYRKLMATRIGRPDTDGTPSPYMSGKRYRVRCVETDEASHIYSFYCQQTITSIDAIYTKAAGGNKWDTASPSSTDATAKTVTFASDPGADVAVDITVNTTDHPCDIITDIITNELSLDTDQYDASSIATTKSRTSGLAVGVAFENIAVLEAFRMMGLALDAGIYIENGVLKVVSYYPAIDESFTITGGSGGHLNVKISDSIANIQNTASLFYGNYTENKTDYVQLQLADSVTSYGELARGDFLLRYEDPVSITSSTEAEEILGHWLSRQDDQYETILASMPLEILRTRIMDIVSLTATKHSMSGYKAQIFSRQINLTNFNGTLTLIGYPSTQWAFAQDAGATEDLYYAVDDPTPADQVEYKSYAY